MSENARDSILARVGSSLGGERTKGVRLTSTYTANIIPARTQHQGVDLAALFVEMAETVKCTVIHVSTNSQVPQAVASYLAEHNLTTELVMAPDHRLDEIPWSEASMLRFGRRAAQEADLVAVTGTFAAIAETGTLMMVSDPERPNTLNFLPDNHIVVVDANDIVATYEDAWIRLRGGRQVVEMPRTVSFITGPSRTSDIELVPTLGAHGPRRLHIVISGVRSGDVSAAG